MRFLKCPVFQIPAEISSFSFCSIFLSRFLTRLDNGPPAPWRGARVIREDLNIKKASVVVSGQTPDRVTQRWTRLYSGRRQRKEPLSNEGLSRAHVHNNFSQCCFVRTGKGDWSQKSRRDIAVMQLNATATLKCHVLRPVIAPCPRCSRMTRCFAILEPHCTACVRLLCNILAAPVTTKSYVAATDNIMTLKCFVEAKCSLFCFRVSLSSRLDSVMANHVWIFKTPRSLRIFLQHHLQP